MSGPTREEVDAVLLAMDDVTCRYYSSQRDPVEVLREYPLDVEKARAVLNAIEPLLRARHIREAVEGLPTADVVTEGDGLEYVQVSWEVGGCRGTATMPRAALLAALTGEGK